jgi:hypothetical protein
VETSFSSLGGATGWLTQIDLTEEVPSDLMWLRDHLRKLNVRFAWRPAEIVILATDASSSVGWGATRKAGESSFRAQGSWNARQKEELDIYMLKMVTIQNSVQSFRDALRGRRIQVLTDNVICKYALRNG